MNVKSKAAPAEQQFPLGTAAIASYLYPALGGADARNEGEARSLCSPFRSPKEK